MVILPGLLLSPIPKVIIYKIHLWPFKPKTKSRLSTSSKQFCQHNHVHFVLANLYKNEILNFVNSRKQKAAAIFDNKKVFYSKTPLKTIHHLDLNIFVLTALAEEYKVNILQWRINEKPVYNAIHFHKWQQIRYHGCFQLPFIQAVHEFAKC